MNDEFILSIDPVKFRSTNAPWNDLMLNDPWSVGYVSSLIEAKEWTSKEEWESAYYASGNERRNLIGTHSDVLDNFQLQRYDKNKINSLSWTDKNLNYQKGRTKEDLELKAKFLYENVKDNGYGLSISDCIECVRFRTICETWNGIIIRENNTISTLKRLFPSIDFCKTSGEIDHNYAVDYELKSNGRLICGIQIKPKSYMGSAKYLENARNANARKYADYKQNFGVDVCTVISKTNGDILNQEVLDTIKNMAK